MDTDTANTSGNFELHLHFAAPAERVFTALATTDGAKGWWTQYSQVSESVGGQSSFRFPSGGFFAVMRTLRREPPRLLEWECIDSKHDDSTGYADLNDWVGTRILFEIKDLGDAQAQLDFIHFRLTELECGSVCSSGWSFLLNQSLRDYLENGKGQPVE
jgi:uncharacterized protein YndB with AHSA1/START domain